MSDREEFEKWISHDMAGVPLERSEKHGHYLEPCLNRIWRTWQARQAEIDALKQRILELEASYDGCEKANEYNKAVIERLMEINADIQKDAKRYRFLRKQNALPLSATPTFYVGLEERIEEHCDLGWVGCDLDHAIDTYPYCKENK